VFYLSRRQTRAAMSAAAGAAVYLAASELGKDRIKLTGLFVLASVSMAGMATAQSSSKAKNVERRFNNLLTNGGTFGGNVTVNGTQTVNGDHHITGSLFGSGGSLPVDGGTKLQAAGGLSISSFTLTMNHGDPSEPGGAPLSYSASYATADRDYTAATVTGCSNSGIFQ
jgi:hypothetical protein